MPAPRPASSLSTRSKTSTSQPARRSISAANSPLIEPPTMRARRLPALRIWLDSHRFLSRKSCYISGQTRRNAMALTMLDKQPETSLTSAWTPELVAEFEREKNNPNPCVGNALVSESDRVRVWTIRLKPGERRSEERRGGKECREGGAAQ